MTLPIKIITYDLPLEKEIKRLINSNEPKAVRGNFKYKKYVITIEEYKESNEEIAARLEKLWIECANPHNWYPLQLAAKEIGYTFKGKKGEARKR